MLYKHMWSLYVNLKFAGRVMAMKRAASDARSQGNRDPPKDASSKRSRRPSGSKPSSHALTDTTQAERSKAVAKDITAAVEAAAAPSAAGAPSVPLAAGALPR
jgi:hypothetical protein